MENFVFLTFSVGFLIISFLHKRGSKELLRASFLIYLLGIVILFSLAFFKTIYTYFLWKNHPLSHFLLPPFRSINYFLGYSFFHFFRLPLYNFFSSFILFALMKIFNKIFNKRLFYEEEIYFGSFGMLVAEFPTNLFLVFLIIILGIFVFLIKKIKIFKGLSLVFGTKFVSLYYLWLPLTIFVIIFKNYLLKLPVLEELIL